MAITYNKRDNIYYGLAADRAADTLLVLEPTNKFYEYDTDTLYITDGTTWRVAT